MTPTTPPALRASDSQALPEWEAQAAVEPYRIGTNRRGRWFVYDVRTGAHSDTFATREAALARADQANVGAAK